MARHTISIDRRTIFGKNMFNFLVGMRYVDVDNPEVADVDERTSDGKKIMQILYDFGIVKSPYNKEYVAMIKKAEREIQNGRCTEVDDVDKFINEL